MENIIKNKTDFELDGVTLKKSLINQDEVQQVLDDINRFVNEKKNQLEEGREINYADKDKGIVNSLHMLENYDGYFFHELAKRKSIVSIAENLLNCEVKLLSVQSFVKPKGKGLPAPFHQDNAYWCIEPADGLTIWIALDSCNKENGMVKYIKGSHKIGVVKHTPSLAPGSSQIILENDLPKGEVFCPDLSQGDAAIHHTMNIHGSNPNTSGNQRRGLLFCYCSKKALRNKDLFERYQKNLSKLILMRKDKREL